MRQRIIGQCSYLMKPGFYCKEAVWTLLLIIFTIVLINAPSIRLGILVTLRTKHWLVVASRLERGDWLDPTLEATIQ
jgi:hypothetical protein